MASQIGHIEYFDERNKATPSVFIWTVMSDGSIMAEWLLYIAPSYHVTYHSIRRG